MQRPYRWNLRRLRPGHTLDVGCGIGRALAWVDGVGVDHNPTSVEHCRRLGLTAYTTEEFASYEGGLFDTILLSHVAEHMTTDEVISVLRPYLEWLKPDGQLIVITPQERGFASDPTHVEFMDFAAIDRVLEALGLVPERKMSFPFPRAAGKAFIYNEFVVTARRQGAGPLSTGTSRSRQ